MQPPPLAPLLLNASDYLSGATLHQVIVKKKKENPIEMQQCYIN